jgi:hypothetical protein
VHFHNDRCAINAQRQVADFALTHIMHPVQASTASATLKASDPKHYSVYEGVERKGWPGY